MAKSTRLESKLASGTISLTEGQVVPIQVEYYESKGAAKMVLKWIGPGISKRVIPTTALWSLP